ncbi:MAG: arginine--tRNA ligase [Candidatus Omnitrophica bacterium CG10_big_fil_rev_8_21_14_0_10_43_8]|nr:MAG: arginine--tRNA ligase [Candidatus Omnitrophica bacterium CG10_big_fil_rev_8_21_14_0_10_43_8]
MDTDKLLKKIIYDASRKLFKGVSITEQNIILQAPKLPEHGHISTNIAMRVSKAAGISGMEAAGKIIGAIQRNIIKTPLNAKISQICAKEPGFINFFFTNLAIYDVLEDINKKGDMYGSCDMGKNRKIQIEFVSANPTGPLSVAHGRQAAVGDALGNILDFAGWKVTREYFINDQGRQMDILGESIRQRYLEFLGQSHEFPEEGYKGEYIRDIAKLVMDKYSDKYIKPDETARSFFRDYGCEFIMNVIKSELEDFGVIFDVWTSQAKLVSTSKIEGALKILRKKKFLYESEGAVWFKSTAFGDDKDRVVIKSDGSYTYLAPDIAYHQDKFQRKFDKVINIWGPDHHGYIPRITAAVQALGFAKDAITVLIVQLATLWRGTEQVRMSTRAGEFVTLRQVMQDTGKDAARFFFLARKISSHLDFDIELAKKQSQENPVYYVQYAHARICNIIEHANAEGHKNTTNPDFKLLIQQEELDLIRELGEFPSVIALCAQSLEPCGLVSYLQSTANKFHSFYDKHRVVSDDTELTKARLALIAATKTVLSTALRLLGVSAPIKM